MFPPQPVTYLASVSSTTQPGSWTAAYTDSAVVSPKILSAELQTLQAFQTGTADPSSPLKRYFSSERAFRQYGLKWAECSEIATWNDVTKGLYAG